MITLLLWANNMIFVKFSSIICYIDIDYDYKYRIRG